MRNILILSGIFSILLPVTDVNAARVIQKCIDSGGAVTYARACPGDTSDIITIKSSLSGLSKQPFRSLKKTRSNILSGNFEFSRSTANSGFNSREVSYRRNLGGSDSVSNNGDASATGSDGDIGTISDGGANQVGRSTIVNSGSAYRLAQNDYSNGLMERWRNFVENYFGWGNDSSSGSDETADNTNTDSNDSGSEKTADNTNTDSNDSGSEKTADNTDSDAIDSDNNTADNTNTDDSDDNEGENNTADNTDNTDAGVDSDSNSTGTLQDGAIVEIHGSGFGSKNNAAPVMFDTTNTVWINGKETHPYAGLSDGATVPTGDGYPWRANGYSDRGDFKIARNGNDMYYKARINDADAWIETPQAFEKINAREIYISWYLKLSFDAFSIWEANGGSNKFIRVWTKNEDTRISWTVMHMVYGGTTSWTNTKPVEDQWNRYEVYANLDTGTVKMWLTTPNGDRQLIHDRNDMPRSSSSFLPRLVGWDSNKDDYGGETLTLKDYYADTTAARVEICDAPTWNKCSIRELQLPLEWSNNKIVVRVNQGRIANLDKGYLYVINKNGNVINTNGYPL